MSDHESQEFIGVTPKGHFKVVHFLLVLSLSNEYCFKMSHMIHPLARLGYQIVHVAFMMSPSISLKIIVVARW